MKIRAVVFEKAGSACLREFDLEPCGDNEVIAEVIYSFISPGTELRVYAGKQPNAVFPLIPGYSWVGRITETGCNIRGWNCGDLVSGRNAIPVSGITSCWGGQASHHRCNPASDIVKLPEDADPWNYIHAEVASISYRGMSSAFPMPEESAAVIGQGLIGAFCTKWLLLHGVRVIAVDMEDFRLRLARKWGATATLNAKSESVREQILSYCGSGLDIVVEASGSLAGAKLGTSLLRQPSTQAVRTRYNTPALHTSANIWPRMVYQASYYPKSELPPCGIQNVEGALVLTPSDRSVADRNAVVEHIRRGNLPVNDIVEAPTSIEEAPFAYNYLRDNPDKVHGIAFQWKRA